MIFAGTSQFEGVGHNAIAAPPREDGLLDRHFDVSVAVETAADLGVFTLVVLPDDAEVDFTCLAVTKRTPDTLNRRMGRRLTYCLKARRMGINKPHNET